jgi:hypothetical protein
MYRKIVLCLIGLLLTACIAEDKAPPPVSFTTTSYTKITFTVKSTSIPSVKLTQPKTIPPSLANKIDTPTPTPWSTPKPSGPPTFRAVTLTTTLSSTPTMTFDPINIRTATLSSASLCPDTLLKPAPTPAFLYSDKWMVQEGEILDFLNAYGPQPLIDENERAALNHEPEFGFKYQDLTNDKVPEIILGIASFYIFGCNGGKYQTLLSLPADAYMMPARIIEIQDVNRDGIPELTLVLDYDTQGGHGYQIYEWNGHQFHSLLISSSPGYPESGEIYVSATGKIYYQDIDGDGIKELIALKGIPVWESYYNGLPWRNETWYYKWNGSNYISYNQEFDPPQYRFQAVQDGDRFVLSGEYDRALKMYQQAIFSDTLEWWSIDRRQFLQDVWTANLQKASTPTPPKQDINEYYYLAAYARYRIMLLYFVRGWQQDAQIVYESLQDKFPEGQFGHEYAEMAKVFWDDYQSSQDISHACTQAVAYAAQNPGILAYLGSDYHGWQSINYKPDDICPFR